VNLLGLDTNVLKQLLASGQITDADLQGATLSGSFGGGQNALQTLVAANYGDQPGRSMQRADSPSAYGVQDQQHMSGLADPRLGDLDHELVETPDRHLAPEELAMRDALWSGAGDPDASARIEDLIRQRMAGPRESLRGLEQAYPALANQRASDAPSRESLRALEQQVPGLAQQSSEQPSTDELRRKGYNFVRNESTGQTIFLGPNGQASDRPTYGSQIQGQQSRQSQTMHVIGAGGGSTVDLGDEQAVSPQLDYGRPQIEIAGVGKGYYDKTGRNAYIKNGDGSLTKVVLGYDLGGSMALTKARLEADQTRAQIAHTQEATIASQEARNQKEGIPGMGIPQSVLDKQFGKAPEGKRWTPNGQLEDIPGAGPGKLTESQGKAAGLASRAQAAHDILTDFEGKGVTTPSLVKMGAESVPLVGGALAAGVNAMRIPSSAQNRVEQAQRDFVNAALRVESGASISQSEFDNARKQYFPQPGDSQEVIHAKQLAREREIRSLAIQAGPGAGAAGVSTQPVTDPITKSRALFDAKKAIQAGASPQAVRARLAAMGIQEGV
jgi:hypothetical protein